MPGGRIEHSIGSRTLIVLFIFYLEIHSRIQSKAYVRRERMTSYELQEFAVTEESEMRIPKAANQVSERNE
jgi:hypothetical protein